MKGYFSIEWLSQSSQETSGTGPRAPADQRLSVGPQNGPYTSSTQPETLPGYYSSHGRSSEKLQEGLVAPHDHIHGPPSATHRGPGMENTLGTEMGFSSCVEEEETSGYESEGGRSLSPATPQDTTATSPETSPASGRRPRTAFTAEQINRLEKAFKRNAYLGTHDKTELCKKLSLSDKQIRNWFQNRRMKLKRTLQDALAQACQAKATSQLMQYPEAQAFWPSYYSVHESPNPYLTPARVRYAPQATLASAPAVSLDSLYQCASAQGLVMPTAGAPIMSQYYPYPHHY
ncbi:ventrally expressed dharma/bozozok antagonist [Conger conger]|uniref:ventrally expressed dharma/bozozok antagonist n=1 Tax=Conger conger TaxID=82655 RepID=UPI002A5A84E6|nr:ventrally expressed dharma/bozozok antagonist [Conger conger]